MGTIGIEEFNSISSFSALLQINQELSNHDGTYLIIHDQNAAKTHTTI